MASCSFVKRGLILIIFGKQHQHIFRNYMHIQLSLPLQFYFICFQIAAMEMTRHQRLTDLNQCLIDMWGSIT